MGGVGRGTGLFALAAATAIASCVLPDLALEGKQCPCAEGDVCDPARNRCVSGPTGGSDGGGDGGPSSDAPSGDGPIDAASDGTGLDAGADAGTILFFDDFSAGLGRWQVVGGQWSVANQEAVQTNSTANVNSEIYVKGMDTQT